MADPRQMLPHGGRAPGQSSDIDATVSTLQPAPGSFTDPLFVVLDYDPDTAIRIDNWPAIHGATLPALGAVVTLIYTDQHNWRVAWWDGAHS